MEKELKEIVLELKRLNKLIEQIFIIKDNKQLITEDETDTGNNKK